MTDFEGKVLEGLGGLKADVQNLKEWTERQDTEIKTLHQRVNNIPKAVNGTKRTMGIAGGTGAMGAAGVIIAKIVADVLGGS